MVKRTLVKIQGEMKRSASRSPTGDSPEPTIWECQHQDLRPPTQIWDEEGIFKGKFHNGTVNGIAIDLKILSLDVDVTDWHLNASIGAMSNAFGLNSDFGLNTSTQAMEFNISGYR